MRLKGVPRRNFGDVIAVDVEEIDGGMRLGAKGRLGLRGELERGAANLDTGGVLLSLRKDQGRDDLSRSDSGGSESRRMREGESDQAIEAVGDQLVAEANADHLALLVLEKANEGPQGVDPGKI